MASQEYNSADLTSILKTLSALSNPGSQNNQNPPQADTHEDPYEPPEAVRHPSTHNVAPRPTGPAPPQTTLHQNPHSKPAGNTIDPATITAWPAAIRYVMRTVSANEDVQRRIRRLIQSQHDHEKQWWQGREALLKKQSARVEKKKELDEVLRSVGAPVDEKEVSTVEENQAELTNYDAKVYKASRQMADAMVLELRALKIPFFNTNQSLIESSSNDHVDSKHPQTDDGQQMLLSKDELSSFQRRMLELLQDLCKE